MNYSAPDARNAASGTPNAKVGHPETLADGKLASAIGFPDARPPEDRSGKDSSVAQHALPALRLPHPASRDTASCVRPGEVPKMRRDLGIQHSNTSNRLSSDAPQGHRSGGVRSWLILGGRF